MGSGRDDLPFIGSTPTGMSSFTRFFQTCKSGGQHFIVFDIFYGNPSWFNVQESSVPGSPISIGQLNLS